MTTQRKKAEYFLSDSLANLEKDLRSLYTSETYEKFFRAHLEEIRSNIDDSLDDDCGCCDPHCPCDGHKQLRFL